MHMEAIGASPRNYCENIDVDRSISSLPYSGHATRLVLMGVYDHLLPACSRTSCLLAAFLVVHSNDVRTHNVSTTIG